VVGVETFRPEVGVNILAVSGGSSCGKGAFTMSVVVGCTLESGLLPKDLARLTVDANHFEKVFMIGADAVGMEKLAFGVHVLDGFRPWHERALDRSRKEDLVAPNNR